MSSILLFLLLIFAGANGPAHAARKASPALTLQAADEAQWSSSVSGPVLLKAQVLLDRAGFSPGTIDAREGGNFEKALGAFQQAHGLDVTGKLDQITWDQLVSASNEPRDRASFRPVRRRHGAACCRSSGPSVKNFSP
jgi:peptidoglycan hydrolase-like protein with peptidoglycan-binding domain